MTYEEYHIRHGYEIAVRNMTQAGWEKMTIAEKVQDLQAVEIYNAMEQERIPATVYAESMVSGEWGYQAGNNIVVSQEGLEENNLRETTDTMFHEGSHVRDFQANVFPEIQAQYTPEELDARNTPIPDPNLDYQGYYEHPAEVAAREAGAAGVSQVTSDRAAILAADELQAHPHNQILETFDYLALDDHHSLSESTEIPQEETANLDWSYEAGEPTAEPEFSENLSNTWTSEGVNMDAELDLADNLNEDDTFDL